MTGEVKFIRGNDRINQLAQRPDIADGVTRAAISRYTREDIQHAYAAKLERYTAIRRDAGAGMSERAVERKNHVGRRTIIKALDTADPQS